MQFVKHQTRGIEPVLRAGLCVDRLVDARIIPALDVPQIRLDPVVLLHPSALLDHPASDVKDDPRLISRGGGGQHLRPVLSLFEQTIELESSGNRRLGVLPGHGIQRRREAPQTRILLSTEAEQVADKESLRRMQVYLPPAELLGRYQFVP